MFVRPKSQMIDNLPLPKTLPSEKAMESWKQSHCDYEPEFWEFFYDINRYLKHLEVHELVGRHAKLLRNLRRLTCRERSIIPINSFLSSWYWYKKEHQTRYELFKRDVDKQIDGPLYKGIGDLSNPLIDPRTDLLFRFERTEHARAFLDKGAVRIRRASVWKQMEEDEARRDDELRKSEYHTPEATRVTTERGERLPVSGYITKRSECADFHALCMTNGFHKDLFEDFADSECVMVVKRPDELARRLENCFRAALPGWYFHHNPIEYYDPYEHDPRYSVDPTMSKNFLQAYQMEYRFLWFPVNPAVDPASLPTDLQSEMGPLDDIAEFLPKELFVQGPQRRAT